MMPFFIFLYTCIWVTLHYIHRLYVFHLVYLVYLCLFVCRFIDKYTICFPALNPSELVVNLQLVISLHATCINFALCNLLFSSFRLENLKKKKKVPYVYDTKQISMQHSQTALKLSHPQTQHAQTWKEAENKDSVNYARMFPVTSEPPLQKGNFGARCTYWCYHSITLCCFSDRLCGYLQLVVNNTYYSESCFEEVLVLHHMRLWQFPNSWFYC